MSDSLLKSSMPRTQLKLVLILSVLVALVSTLSGIVVERGLRNRETVNTAQHLAAQGRLVQRWIGSSAQKAASPETLDRIALRASQALASRITLIDRKGVVLADSDVPRERIPEIENHASRSEVASAINGELGVGSRLSGTVGRRLYYVAVPSEVPEGVIVRIAVELPEIEEGAAAMRRELIFAGLWGVLAAVILSFAITAITLRPLAEIRRVVSAISHGDLKGRLYVPKNSELGDISSAINVVAERMRSQVQDALAEKERLQAVLTGMVEGVLVLDLEDHVMLANPAFCDLFGLTEQDLVGRPLTQLVRSPELSDLLKDARERNEPTSGEMNRVGAGSGRTLLLHAVGFPADGSRMGTVAVFHDVTEIRRLERIRGDFVANASHELRTPLTAIKGFAETLLGNQVSAEEQRQYIEIIDRHSERLANLINDLLELSRIESGHVSLSL
ncbi:MAG: PAS domain S-box protein, partial [Deltaproteobacteria bacterium]|nr:PAS domain S-box protein [Deltaproteobacteria bacterium]